MSKLWSDLVRQLDPYVPGEQPKEQGLIKLNTNENPYAPSPAVLDVFFKETGEELRLYPDPNSVALKQAVAKTAGVESKNVFVGNGSDEVLALAFMAFFKQKKPLLFPDISYSFYPVYCNLLDIKAKTVPLTDDFSINVEDYIQANGGIIFPNPNAPTGVGLSLEKIEVLLQANTNTVVIVDEAYIDFGGESAIPLIDRYPNVLIVQTLSKSRSLAGLRVGFAIGDAELIEGLDRVKNSFNSYPIDRIAEKTAIAALNDQDYFEECTTKIIATREQTIQQLKKLGFEVLPSQANFVFAKPTKLDAETIFTRLREEKIIVRYFNKPRISDYLRITIGTDEEMEALIVALGEILA